MYPSLLAGEAQHAVTEYLSTTFALADDEPREALHGFLNDSESGIFRGPYLSVRAPFQPMGPQWQSPLDWMPSGFRPYRHQAAAFERLSTRDSAAEPTIVTTGTGSGKTESFLVPLLDHAARAKEGGQHGIKALLLYPMNALAGDQARRLAELICDEPALRGLTAGLYVGRSGNHSRMSREHLIDKREALRQEPPDILLTNYRMLDLLLLRAADAPLWRASRESLQYLVLDEFHTYDGAQGTDVAMLLRRLGSALLVAQPDRPLGRITPVATSATLGGSTRDTQLRDFAETVFGTPFSPESVVTEHRMQAEEVVPEINYDIAVPDVEAVNQQPAPDLNRPDSWKPLAETFLGFTPADEVELGAALRQSYLTRAVIHALGQRPQTPSEAVRIMADSGLLQWGVDQQRNSAAVEQALLRYLALISAARVTDGNGHRRPLLHVEVQLWVRELSRMLRAVSHTPRFAWHDDQLTDHTQRYLPAVYCRVCGRSGWQAKADELADGLEGEPTQIWRANVTRSERRQLRTLLAAGPEEIGARRIDPLTLEYLPDHPTPTDEEATDNAVSVLLTPSAEDAQDQRCPSCQEADALTFLGSSVATLVSVALTQLFGSDLLEDEQKKTLVFTDSVQDAAHRAAFIEGRAYQFNVRSAILAAMGTEPRSLHQVGEQLGNAETAELTAIAPPDFARRLGLDEGWLQRNGHRQQRKLLGERLSFQAQLQLGLRSRLGRTLELTGALAVDYDVALDHYAGLARETHQNLPGGIPVLPGKRDYARWIIGLLDRLRRRGGIEHPWLKTYRHRDGNRWSVSGGAPRGMPRFPPGMAAPRFFTTAAKWDFESLQPKGHSWLTDWTQRCLNVQFHEAKALLPPVMRLLAQSPESSPNAGQVDLPSQQPLQRSTSQSDAAIFGLRPQAILLTPLPEEELDRAQLRCPVCHYIQPCPPARFHLWNQAPCPRIRCDGRLEGHPVRPDNYYRQLYRAGRLRHLVAHEHTALLNAETRRQVEQGFASGDSVTDPNVLTCTPTLELGIDIGRLSAVGLASLPRGPASYLQRVGRAGRATGNAFIMAMVPGNARDLYYLAEPRNLIAGEVLPPAAYLSATELLHRQYLAFCLDRVASGQLDLHRSMPGSLKDLLGDGLTHGSWLRSFADAVAAESESLASAFLQLYGARLDDTATASVRQFSRSGVGEALARLVTEWSAKRSELAHRQDELSRAISELDRQGHLDDRQSEDRRRWRAELKAMRKMLQTDGDRDALTGLGEEGLLPTYNLHDETTELDVSLWWTTDDESGKPNVTNYSYGRGSRTALQEFAPGAVFYAQGFRVKIDAVEVGPYSHPHYRAMRLCPDCGWGSEQADDPPVACPRCGSAAVTDTGAVHNVLDLQRVSANHRRDDALIEDETDERTRVHFDLATGVDVDPKDTVHAWRLAEVTFGAEYIRRASVRTINLGPVTSGGSDISVAGHRSRGAGFTTCAHCGVVRAPRRAEHEIKHRGWCPTRRSAEQEWVDLVLSHQIVTQAVRILLPLSTFNVDQRLTSFRLALLLGLRADFGGDPQHLQIVTARMPDAQRRPRQFLVLHDTVPGGTGYLDRLGQAERMRSILSQALAKLQDCPCRNEGRAACHRCLLGVAERGEVEQARRDVAIEMLAELISKWEVENVGSVTDIDITPVQLSELELRFRETLKAGIDAVDQQSWSSTVGEAGEELDIRLVGPDGQPRRWMLRPLVRLRAGSVATEPDFLLTRQDRQDAPVAIYLDGKQFHASVDNQRTADDAHKRAALREDGYRVWSLTWDDVEDYARIHDGYQSRTAPLLDTGAANQVRETVDDRRVTQLWGNPMLGLLFYLQDPQAEVWEAGVTQSMLTIMRRPEHTAGPPLLCPPHQLSARLGQWARGAKQDDTEGGQGTVAIARCVARSGLPIAVVGSTAHSDPTATLGALIVLDDRDTEVGGSRHDRQWREWLRWSNLLQFLSLPRYGYPMPLRMGECWTRGSLELLAARTPPLAASPESTPVRVDVSYPQWGIVLEYAPDIPAGVVQALAQRQIPPPEPGGEVGDTEIWQVEYCWPQQRVAVVVDSEQQRDQWLHDHGWRLLRFDGQHEEALVRDIAAAVGGTPS